MISDWYDSIPIGEEVTTRGRTITETDVVSFSMLSGDWNPLHTDETYSATGPFGRRIAHGMLVLSVMTGLIRLDAPYVLAFYGFDRVRFLRPTLFGDTIHVTSTVTEKSDHPQGGVVACSLAVLNQDGEAVAACTMKLLVARDPAIRLEPAAAADGAR